MADIDGGALSFKSILDNDQLDSAVDESLKRIQGLSDGTVSGGKAMDEAFSSTANNIRKAINEIAIEIEKHENELHRLTLRQEDLSKRSSEAFMSGRDMEHIAMKRQIQTIEGEIRVRKNLIKELAEQSNKLEDAATKVEEQANAHETMRKRIRELREEMMSLVEQGIDRQSDAYKALEEELARLLNIQRNVHSQGKALSHNYAGLQGVVSGLSGIAGAFSAATGAISLFAGENDNLQKIMTKVQSVMAISIGVQQVSNTLNRDSAFQLVTMTKLREWWNGVVAKSTIATSAETKATIVSTAAKKAQATATGAATVAGTAHTAATTAQAGAATAGTVANVGLAGSFRMIGAAIKSIPVFGWILAGISGLITLVSALTRSTRKAKKEQQEFNKELIEGSYQAIGAVEYLSTQWNNLGDDLESKKEFVDANKKAFDELGVSIVDVADAENLLVANKQNFIDAQIAKAKAAIYLQQTTDKIEKQMKLKAEIDEMSDTRTMYVGGGMFGGMTPVTVENTAKTKKQTELKELKDEITQGYENAALEESEAIRLMSEAGIDAANTYLPGTLGAIENAIRIEQEALRHVSDTEEYKKKLKEIEELQRQAENITGQRTKPTGSKSKDPFLEKLEKQKKEYQRFMKWVNSGDEILAKAANKEFEGLLQQGATYIDYLRTQRDQILSIDIAERTKAQNQQLRTLNDQIAEETRQTVLESFNIELSNQLNNARSMMEMLSIIEQRRKELADDGTEIDIAKKESLDEAEQDIIKQSQQETDALLADYASYIAVKIQLEEQFNNDLILLQKRRLEATTDAEREEIDKVIANRRRQYEQDSKTSGSAEYDDMLKMYATFESRKQTIIDEYDEKRRIAQEHNNQELIEQLNDAQAKALSSLASDELMDSDMWSKLFSNMDELAASDIEILVKEIESQFDALSDIFDPIDLDKIRNKLNEAKAILIKDNPFKQVGVSLKAIFNSAADDSEDSASNIKRNWKNLADATQSSFDFVKDAIDSADFLKDAIGEVGSTAISSLSAVASTSIAVATAIKTAETSTVILAIIQAALIVVQQVVNLVNSIAGDKDAKIEKQIQKHADAVNRLESDYNALSWAIDKALGGDKYRKQQEAIDNLKRQREELQAMWDEENGRKKKDQDKLNEYSDQMDQLGREISDVFDEMTDNILSIDARGIADKLGDAFIEAFKRGEDAAEKWGESVDDIVSQIVRNLLIQKLLQEPVGQLIDDYSKKWFDQEGNFLGFDAVANSLGDFALDLNDLSKGFISGFENLPDELKELILGKMEDDFDTSLSGSVKGVTEETASVLAGQINAIRMSQMEATETLRNQLFHLANIDRNTFAIDANTRYIKDIYDRITTGDTLRSQGLS